MTAAPDAADVAVAANVTPPSAACVAGAEVLSDANVSTSSAEKQIDATETDALSDRLSTRFRIPRLTIDDVNGDVVDTAYRIVLGRQPSNAEHRIARKLAVSSEVNGLNDLCHVLFNSNAFFYLE